MRAETSELISISGANDQHRGAVGGTLPDSIAATVAPRRRFDIAALPVVTRAQQIAMALDKAFDDDRFRASIAQADAARDHGDWGAAEREYGKALRLQPLHWGYCIQYAHVVKEQGLFACAEAWYRSAVALGAPADMVDEHLAFVARLNGVTFVRLGVPRLDVAPMLAPPTCPDIRLLGELACVPGLAGEDLMLDVLRTSPDNRSVWLRFLEKPQFARASRPFLDILRAQSLI